MTQSLAQLVWSFRRIESAWLAVKDNARTSRSSTVRSEVEEFGIDASKNIRSISSKLSRGTFAFLPAKGIPIPKLDANGNPRPGKIRPIVLAPLPSRIVQRAILEVLCDVPALSQYINTPHSFGGLKKSQGELGTVPAAIDAVLTAIGSGGRYIAFADIKAFFTRISKTSVTDIIRSFCHDAVFLDLFKNAIEVELENIALIRQYESHFPISDIGVAQGNSLSPLLGNIILHDFDSAMNQGDCHCVRYIDDFVIIAPTAKAAASRLRLATEQLDNLGKELSPEKSLKKPIDAQQPFEFLGIEMANGLIRPSAKARARLMANIRDEFAASRKAFNGLRSGKPIPRNRSLVATLKRVDGMINGWGKHYRFCNDRDTLANVDSKIEELIKSYIQQYALSRSKTANSSEARQLLGVGALADIELAPLIWPPRTAKSLESS